MDCGPACLYMICRFYGRNISLQKLRNLMQVTKDGVNLLSISDAAESMGFRTLASKITLKTLQQELSLPCIIHWNQNHFVIVYKVRKKRIFVADPGNGLLYYDAIEFSKRWCSDISNGYRIGVALQLEPTSSFFEQETLDETSEKQKQNLSFNNIWRYAFPHRRLIIQLTVALFAASMFQLILPFLTQSIIDVGVNTRDLEFIYIVLLAQLALFTGRTIIDFIRTWIVLHINARINIAILTDFLIKLMRLPLSFFDSKVTGDLLQRMNDHQRIRSFLTGSSISILFSVFNLFIFGLVLFIFNKLIFLIYFSFSIVYSVWILLFLRYRKHLDYKQFDLNSQEQSIIIQLIQGMQEIKLQGWERSQRWKWERLQARIFLMSIKTVKLNQFQQAGAFFINEGKNIIITFLAAKAVIEGQLTLGSMLAILYIIGQLNSPIQQMIGFVQQLQDARISMERLNEIHSINDEESTLNNFVQEIQKEKDIVIRNLSFSYPGVGNGNVLHNLNLTIPHSKTTAIVGMSGSGKTTLLKLLLKFYTLNAGEIFLGNLGFDQLSPKKWRNSCGIVMQESYIFSDTIARNISMDDENLDQDKLMHAVTVANIKSFIESLPLKYNTRIGIDGIGISQGQRQRLLIARAIYKQPNYIFFDEATNALDANNESEIISNLHDFFIGRTVVVVAHRLSTIRNADQIVVLNNGEIVEKGTHDELISIDGHYYRLVQRQIEKLLA